MGTCTQGVLRDIRYGLRGLRRDSSFSALVIMTLGLGLGANTAIFSVVHAVLLQPLPYPNSERLVRLGESSGQATGISVTWSNYQHWRDENHTFEAMAGYEQTQFTLTGEGDPLLTRAALVSSGFFPLLGRRVLLGRLFTESDDRPGAPYTVVLNYSFWRNKLGADPAILGSTLALDGKPYQVIGVAAPVWEFITPDYFLPIAHFKNTPRSQNQHGSMRVLARLKPGVTLAEAIADLDSIQDHLARQNPGSEKGHHSYGTFLANSVTAPVQSGLLILMTGVGLVLLIACANVSSLILARGSARTSEIAVRTAIGAGQLRLIRQFLIETLSLALLGGASGLLLARWGLAVLVRLGPRQIPRLSETTLDLPVLVFAGAITILSGLIVGLTPVVTAGKLDLVSALRDSSRGISVSKTAQSLRGALIVFETAITFMLVFAAGLLLQSLNIAQSSYPGFRSKNLLALELSLPSLAYKSGDSQRNFYNELFAGLRSLPRVAEVAAINCPPSGGDCGDWFYSVLDRPAPTRNEVPVALINIATPSYFRTLGIPLREGRSFTEADREGAAPVAIVNQTFARRWWPAKTAVGQRVKSGGPYLEGPVYEIVGVAGDVSQMGLDSKPEPEIYLPFLQSPSQSMVVMIRTAGNPESLVSAVRRRVASLDRNLPIKSLSAFEKNLAASLDRRRFGTMLLTAFALLAMVLGAVGIFGLLNYWVNIREEEIAIRFALGAQPAAILRWLGGSALKLVAAGITFGMAGALLASNWMASVVFGVSVRSSMTMAMAVSTVCVIAILASLIPLLRATRIDAVGKLHRG
jgi:putative ABC transport system permease protein